MEINTVHSYQTKSVPKTGVFRYKYVAPVRSFLSSSEIEMSVYSQKNLFDPLALQKQIQILEIHLFIPIFFAHCFCAYTPRAAFL